MVPVRVGVGGRVGEDFCGAEQVQIITKRQISVLIRVYVQQEIMDLLPVQS